MAFIRNRNEERTGYQSGSSLTPDHDNAVDYVLVYRMDETIFDRLQVLRTRAISFIYDRYCMGSFHRLFIRRMGWR